MNVRVRPAKRFDSRRMIGIFAAVCLLASCETPPRPVNYPGLVASVTPAAWSQPALWDFEVFDKSGQPAGGVVLYFTEEPVTSDFCAAPHWRKAIVVYDDLDIEFDFDKQAAYSISGPWLTMDLTASSCSVDHNFVGQIDDDGARGYFNLAHSLGGKNLGKFIAKPAEPDTTFTSIRCDTNNQGNCSDL